MQFEFSCLGGLNLLLESECGTHFQFTFGCRNHGIGLFLKYLDNIKFTSFRVIDIFRSRPSTRSNGNKIDGTRLTEPNAATKRGTGTKIINLSYLIK
jgi:hypothetical protein